jgi:hypothetical protein
VPKEEQCMRQKKRITTGKCFKFHAISNGKEKKIRIKGQGQKVKHAMIKRRV